MERIIGLDNPAGWARALDGIPHGFGHTWECCHAIHQTRPHPTYLFCWQDEKARVVCPIAERTFQKQTDIVTPYGFSGFASSGPSAGFVEQWRAFVRARNYVCGYIALHPTLNRQDLHGSAEVANTLYVLDLQLGVTELLRRVDQKRRRAIKRWLDSGRRFETDRDRLTQFVVDNHEPFMRRAAASPRTLMSKETLRLLCGSANVHLAGVEEDGVIVAVHASARTPWDAESLILVSLPEGRSYLTALYWDAVERHSEAGVPSFNLGGGLTRDDTIAQSKARYGAKRYDFLVLKELYQPQIYEQLCGIAAVNASDHAGYFPAYYQSPTAVS